MINSPQFMTALGSFFRLLKKRWDPSWNTNQRKIAFIRAAIDANLSSEGLLKENDIKIRNMEKAQTLRARHDFAKASKYLGKSLIRDPSNVQIIKLLADSAYRYWKQSNDKETMFALSQLAGLILMLDPDDLQGMAISNLSTLERQRRSKTQNGLVFVLLLIICGVGVWLWREWSIHGDDIVDTLKTQAEPSIPNLLTGLKEGTHKDTPPTLSIDEAPIGVEIIDQSSILRIDNEKKTFTYLMKAELHNSSKFELSEMHGSISLYSSDGQLIGSRDNLSLIPQHKGPIRPKDIIGFQERIVVDQEKGLTPHKAIVRVTKIQSHQAPTNYAKEIPIRIKWSEPPDENQMLSASLRSAKRQPDINWNTHQIVIKNQGSKTIRTLKLELSYFDDKSRLIDIETEYAVLVSGASLPSGQARLVNFNLNSAQEPKKISLKVIAIK